jgi:uncharacterized protein
MPPDETKPHEPATESGSAPWVRLTIYVGEDKRHGDRPLYQAIVRKAHELGIAGATVFRGTQGFGRSTRLHTADVLFSDDLPAVVEIVDSAPRIDGILALLGQLDGIGLITREPVEVWHPGTG